jgi:hypothetical protein
MDESARAPFHDSTKTPDDLRITIDVSNCLFWETIQPWGGVRVVDTWPANLTLTDNQFIDNYAITASAFNIGLYGGMFPQDSGVLGRSYHSYVRNEVAALNSNPGFKFEMGAFVDYIYPQQWDAGPGSLRPDVATTILVEDLHCHDYHAWGGTCLLLFNRGNYNGGSFDVSIVDSEIRDVTGAWGSNLAGGSAVWLEVDTIEIARTTFTNAGFQRHNPDRDLEETNLAEGGPIWAQVTEHGRLESVSVTNSGYTSRGGAVALKGTAAFEVINCVFSGNVAIADGGAIFFASTGPLFIQDVIFLNNRVERQIAIPRQIVVNVFTGGTGAGAPIRPVWKLDGAAPDLATGLCGSETIYGNNTYDQQYDQGQLYAEVLTTTSGEHTLWFGAEVFKSSPLYSWDGGGWISVSGIVTKTFPILCDNRARTDCPAPNNFARNPDCYNADRSADGDQVAMDDDQELQYCPEGQVFWTSIRFTVPSGTGGAIAAAGTGAVTIKDSRFASNQAGFGDALAATGSAGLIVQNTNFDAITSNTFSLEGVDPDDCRQHPCAVGERCTVDQLSLHCNPCPNGQISQDGIECLMCEPGKENNENHTVCVECVDGKHSSATTAGVCDSCPPGTQPANNRDSCTECSAGYVSMYGTACVPCPASQVSSAAEALCTECPAGQSSGGRIVCESCPAGRTRPQGQPDCSPCTAGMEPDGQAASCVPCTEMGFFSQSGEACSRCVAGTQPFANRTGCDPCPPGMAGLDGTCALCQAGRYAESEMQCSACEAGMEPTEDKSGCHCKLGTYDSSSIGLIACDGFVGPASSAMRGSCTECPSCLDCSVRGVVKLKEGWASFGSDSTVFTCPYKAACPEQALNESSPSDQTCAHGYDPASPLCAMCAKAFNAYKVGSVCDPCDDVTINVPLLIGFLAAGLVAVATVVSGTYAWLVDNGMMTDFRIIFGLYQVRSATSCSSFFAASCSSFSRYTSACCCSDSFGTFYFSLAGSL